MVSPHGIYRIKTGTFAGFEAVVAAQDHNQVTVTIEVFGRPMKLWFPISTFDDHLEPFANDPSQDHIDEPTAAIEELRRLHPTANEVYAAHWFEFPISRSIQISRTRTSIRLVVQQLNMTSPIYEKENWQTTINDSVPLSAWNGFIGLVDTCSFWSLPHDDGRRYTKQQSARRYHLEGWNGELYHSVIRQTCELTCEIEPACQFLTDLVSDAVYAAEQVVAPDRRNV